VDGFILHIANSLWAQEGHPFLESFLEVVEQQYGAGVHRVDFVNQPDQAGERINQWVSDQTHEKIKDILPPGVLDSLTRLVLANAIYFNAAWMVPFDEASTAEGTFTLLDGGQTRVPFMNRQGTFLYATGADYQIIELPYIGGQLVMDILVPDTGAFHDVEVILDSIWLSEALESVESAELRLSMPKFEVASEFQLGQALQRLGMISAFGAEADFSGMDGTLELFLKEVLHKSYVRVDEAGTEAAAATAVVVAAKAMPTGIIELTLDRPFIFLIRDKPTQATLFVGRVLNPLDE
jgi:serpin B